MSAQETAAKLQEAWLETEAERNRLLALQAKTIRRLNWATRMLVLAFLMLVWALLVILKVL